MPTLRPRLQCACTLCLHLSFDVAHALQTPARHLLTDCTSNQLLHAAKRIGMEPPPGLHTTNGTSSPTRESTLDPPIRPYLVSVRQPRLEYSSTTTTSSSRRKERRRVQSALVPRLEILLGVQRRCRRTTTATRQGKAARCLLLLLLLLLARARLPNASTNERTSEAP